MIEQSIFRRYHGYLKSGWLQWKGQFAFCAIAVFCWGMVAHGYGFLNTNLNHDVLTAFTATPWEISWKIALGRFLVPLNWIFLRGDVTIPWLIGLIGLAWMVPAVFLVIRIFDVRSKFMIVFVAGLMTTNISWISQIAAYTFEYDFNCLALMLSILAVYLWNRDRGTVSIITGGICILASIAIYQAFFAVTITLIIFKSIMDLLQDKEVKKVFLHGIKGIGMILLGGLMYLALGKLIYGIMGGAPADRVDVLNMNGQNPIMLFASFIKPAMVYLVKNILHAAYRSPEFIVLMAAVCILVGVSAIYVIVAKKFRLDRMLLIILLVALLPLGMTSIFILSKNVEVHDLTKHAIWFFYSFLLLYAFQICGKDAFAKSGFLFIVRAMVCVLLGVILWQNIILANTAYIKKDIEAGATLSTMTRVVSMMEQQEEYIAGETPVVFIGIPETEPTSRGMAKASTITGLQQQFAVTYDYEPYFKYVLQQPVLICSDDVCKQMQQDERVLALPAFPQKGYMEMIDGILVVKMFPSK